MQTSGLVRIDTEPLVRYAAGFFDFFELPFEFVGLIAVTACDDRTPVFDVQRPTQIAEQDKSNQRCFCVLASDTQIGRADDIGEECSCEPVRLEGVQIEALAFQQASGDGERLGIGADQLGRVVCELVRVRKSAGCLLFAGV